MLSNVVPCLRVVVTDSISNFGMPSPPSRLLQYSRPLGVLEGRWRNSLTCVRTVESKPRMVVIGGGEGSVMKEMGDYVGG